MAAVRRLPASHVSARGETNEVQDDFIGLPMYFSSYGPDTNRKLLDAAGFDIVWTKS